MIFTIVVIVTVAIVGLYVWFNSPVDPAHAFIAHADQDIPADVSVIGYREIVSDNFLHPSRYWLLRGSPTSLRELSKGPGFAPSLEDAQAALPNMTDLFGKPWQSSDVMAGFEQDQGRGRWFWIFSGEREALYALN